MYPFMYHSKKRKKGWEGGENLWRERRRSDSVKIWQRMKNMTSAKREIKSNGMSSPHKSKTQTTPRKSNAETKPVQNAAGKISLAIRYFLPKICKFPIPIPAQTDRTTHLNQKWPRYPRNSKVTPWINTRTKNQSNQPRSIPGLCPAS